MAGETRGELAEAIGKVALERALGHLNSADRVFWEDRPADAVIDPDLTIGQDPNAPHNLVLVNASDSPKESDKKYWRNLAEVFDSKVRLASRPSILNLVFRSEIKPELIRLTTMVCDSTHHVDLDPIHGEAITNWLEENIAGAPSKKKEKEDLVRMAIARRSRSYVPTFAVAMDDLAITLSKKISTTRSDLKPLWELLHLGFESRRTCEIKIARDTFLRKGLARWMVLDKSTRIAALQSIFSGKILGRDHIPKYAKDLGMVNPRTGGGVVAENDLGADRENMLNSVGRDLREAAGFFYNSSRGDQEKACKALEDALSRTPDEMERHAEAIRQMPELIERWDRYIQKRWSHITSPRSLFEILTQCHADPTMNGTIALTSSRVWIYDHLIALLRSTAGRNNDFGYGALGSVFKSKQNDHNFRELMASVLSELDGRDLTIAQRWVEKTLPNSAEPGRRGFQDWLEGRKNISPVIIAAYSFSIATLLCDVDPKAPERSDVVARHSYGLWNKLLTYQDFEPLPELIESACGGNILRMQVDTLMLDLAGESVQNAGTMNVYAFDGGLINWQSAYHSHTNDKRKELCGRAVALRYGWSSKSKKFAPRPGLQKLFLVVDGTWKQSDLDALVLSGWDEIFYPDEMDKLAKAIASPL